MPADDAVLIEDGPAEGGAAAALPVIDEEAGAAEAALPKHAVPQEDGSVILPLKRPVTLRFRSAATGAERVETFAELHLHGLTGADMRAIEATKDGSKGAVAIARSARIGEAKFNAIFDLMDARDVGAAAKVVGTFL